MAVYSISDLEKLCGIKAHTLRIWEQRYGIVKPQRTKTNIRYYEDGDLKKVLNIALLNKNGYKISRIAQMDPAEIAEKVKSISEANFEHHTQLDSLTISMIEMDESKFDSIVRSNIKQMGFERTMLEVIYPFLEKLGVLWLTGSIHPVQESHMSFLIRQKLISAIDNIPFPTQPNAKKFMLYLPKGESQELSLLFMNYLLRTRGHQVIYLGQNISIGDLKDASLIAQPDYLFTLITESFSNQGLNKYVGELSDTFADIKLLISGYQIMAQHVDARENVFLLESLGNTLEFLSGLGLEK